MISRCRAGRFAALRWKLQDDIIFQYANSSPYSRIVFALVHHPIVTYVDNAYKSVLRFVLLALPKIAHRTLLQNIAAALEGVLPPAVKRESQKIGLLGKISNTLGEVGRRLFVRYI